MSSSTTEVVKKVMAKAVAATISGATNLTVGRTVYRTAIRPIWGAEGDVYRAVLNAKEAPEHPGLQDFLYEVPSRAGTQEVR